MTRLYPNPAFLLAIRIAIFALIACLPACNFGSFSYGAKPATFVGSPTQQSSSARVPVKFQVKVYNPANSKDELTNVVPFDLGLCSPAMTVEAVTATGELAAVRVRTIVRLSGVSAFKLFSDSNCSTQLPTDGGNATVDIDKGTASTRIYMKTTLLADVNPAYTLVAASSGYTSASRTLRVDQTIQRLSFGLAQNGLVSNSATAGGAVCETFYVNGIDGIGNFYFGAAAGTVGATVKVTSGALFDGSNNDCTGAGSTELALSLNSSADSRKFHYRSGSLTTTSTIGQTSSFTIASRFPSAALTVSTISKPVKFQFLTVPSENVLSQCSAFTLRLLDASNAPVNVPSSETYTYKITTSRISTNAVGYLYANGTCLGSDSDFIYSSFSSSTSQTTFSFKANNYPSDGQVFKVTATPYSVSAPLVLFQEKSTNDIPFRAELRGVVLNDTFSSPRLHICNGPYTLSVHDGRPSRPYIKGGSVTLNTSGTRKYYTDSLCASEISGGVINFAASNSSGSYYFVDTTPLSDGNTTSISITATSANLVTPVTLTIAIRNPLDFDNGFATNGSYARATDIPAAYSSPAIANPRINASMALGDRLVVTGYGRVSGVNRVILARYLTSGVDTSFGGAQFNGGGWIGNGARACDISLGQAPSLHYSFVTFASAQAIAQRGSYLYVAGIVDVTERTITEYPPLEDGTVVPPTTVDVPTRQYFVMRITNDATGSGSSVCPAAGNGVSLYIGRFSGANAGTGVTSLTIDGNKVIVGGYSGDLGALSYDMAYAIHSADNLSVSPNGSSPPQTAIVPMYVGAVRANSQIRFGAVQNGSYLFYGNVGSYVGVLEINGVSASQSVYTSQGSLDYLGATYSGNRTYVLARTAGAKSLVVLRSPATGLMLESFINDNGVTLEGATGGIAVNEVVNHPDSGKIVIGGSTIVFGRAFLVARYTLSGTPDAPAGSAKYRRTWDFGTGIVNDDVIGVHAISDNRTFLTGNVNSGNGIGTVLHLR